MNLARRLPWRPRWLVTLLVIALAAGLTVIVAFPAAAAVEAPLSLAFDQQVYGNVLVGGNAVVVCPANTTACTQASNRQGTQSSGVNDNFYMTQTGANAAKGWFNSSSISLTIPAGASVAYARLQWAGDTNTFRLNGNQTTTNQCNTNNSPAAVPPTGAAATTSPQLTVGANTTVSVTASRFTTDTIGNVANNQPQYYSAAANVTPQFANAPTGSPLTITTANVWTPAGFGCMGGWSLILVYAYPQADPTNAPVKREVFVYDGHVRQNSTDAATTTTISGFRVSGQANVGVVAFEGDWGITGDQFSINGTAQTDPGGPNGVSTNFFTSYAQYPSPSVINNFSVDAKQWDVSTSVIKPGDTSASLTFSTSGDSYLATNIVMSVPIPTLQITKAASPTTVHAGDTVTYTITVTNPAAGSTATNVAVTDPLTTACNKTIGSLTGTTSYTCTGVAGSSTFTNVANVTGTDAQGDALSGSAQATVTVLNPAISITKTADQTAYRPGAVITYTITVKNIGDTSLSGVAVTDPNASGCAKTIGTLAAGATTSYTCTATAPATGTSVSNTANVSGTDTLNRTVTAASTVTATLIHPALTLAKSASPTTVTAAGQTITYSFKVTNSGDSTVNSISIADTFTAPASPVPTISCPLTTLVAAASTTCTGTYTVTQADVDNGSINNSAVANGADIVGGAVASNTSAATVTVTRAPALTIKKTAAPTTVTTAAQSIGYSFVVTNTGNVTLHGITIADTFTAPAGPAPSISCPTTTLAPGAATTCTASYSTTQADIDAGSVTNTATASGLDPTNAKSTSEPSTASVTATPGASLSLVKSASPATVTGAGQSVTYTFRVTNTGNLTVHALSIADTFTAPAGPVPTITCSATTLAPAASTTCTGVYSTTQADIDNGLIKNSAVANALDPQNRPVASAQSNATVNVTTTPSLTMTKTATPTIITAAGQNVHYTFAVRNTGNVTIANLTIADTFTAPAGPLPTITCPVTTLAPNATTTCTADYPASQADVDNGTIKNSATAQGTDPTGAPVTSAVSTATVTATPNPKLTLAKSASPTTITALGQQVAYSFAVTNTGNVTLTTVGITDTLAAPATPPLAITCPAGSLAPTATITCTATYAAAQPDLDNGVISNSATAKAVTPTGTTVTSNQSTATVTVTVTTALTLQKTASPSTISAAGQNVSYTFTVTNSGQTTVSNIAINDSMFTGGAAPACIASTLAPSASTVCTASYTSTQADVDRGSIHNTATASGTGPKGGSVVSPPATATVTAFTSPRLVLTKSADPRTVAAVGTQVTYTFTVLNAGNVTIRNLAISDTLAPPAAPQLGTITCAATTLTPTASTTCTAIYVITQADMNNGSVNNSATANGTDPTGAPVVSPVSTATVAATASAALQLSKSASPTSVSAPGQTVSYTFAVTNSGNVTVRSLAITDTLRPPAGPTPSPITCAATTLDSGGTTTCTATYTVTQADVDFGSIANTAVASGLDPASQPVTSNSSTAVVAAVQSPSITLAKSAAPATVTAAGQRVTYQFVVTNGGNVTINDVTIADTFTSPAGPPITPSCPSTPLAPNASLACTATYTVTQADVDAGSIQNSATASGLTPSGSPISSPPDTATVTATQSPGLSVVKTADPTTVTAAGQAVDYRFSVRNTGNVTTSPVHIVDTFTAPAGPALAITCPAVALPPNATTVCTASYTVTQADVNAGSIVNTARATANDPSGATVTSPPSTARVTVTQQPALTLVKSATPVSVTGAGQRVTYSFSVANSGNVTVTSLAISDTFDAPAGPPLSPITCPLTALDPGASTTCTATYTTTQADVDNGTIDNRATVSGRDPSGAAVVSDPSTASVSVAQAAQLTLTKSVTPATYAGVGQILTYTFTVTNLGNVTVGSLAIADSMFAGADAPSCATRTLAPNLTTACTARHTVTQADLDAGSVQNTATAQGTTPNGDPVSSPPSAATATATQTPALNLAKSAAPTTIDAADADITYTFHVTNTGNVTISDLDIADSFTAPAGPVPAITCAATTLAPAAVTDCSATYTATQADVDNGSVTNTATANGQSPSGAPVASPPSTAAVTVATDPALTVTKTASPTTINAVGQPITYTFLVTNTGNVTLSLLSIDDTLTAPAAPPLTVTCPQPTIAPGAQTTCTGAYTATQADLDNGLIANTATASAQAPDGTTIISPPSGATVSVTQTPALVLTKTPSRTTVTAPDQTITYTFTVQNAGNVTVASIAIADPMFTDAAAPTCLASSLAPGATTTCTATYTTTQADIDAGTIQNTATATAVDPTGGAVISPPVSATVNATQSPVLRLVKSALSSTITTVGQSVTYSFAVTNAGNVTVNDLAIADVFAPPAGPTADAVCPVATLAPNASTTCLASYESTQADFDVGQINNTATANGTSASGTPVASNPSSAVVVADQNPSLLLQKRATPTVVSAPGQQVVYTFIVTNSGNVTVDDLVINDVFSPPAGPELTPTCQATSLPSGQSTNCSAIYVATQADIDAGVISNTATATGTTTAGESVESSPSSAAVVATQAGALTLTKTAAPTTIDHAGAAITYTFEIRNAGNVTVDGVAIEDSMLTGASAPTCDPTSLAPNQTATCTATYPATQADIDAGSIHNTAIATGLDPNGVTISSPQAEATVTVTRTGALTLQKSATTAGPINAAGQTIDYDFAVTNSGNVTLTSLSIADSLTPPAAPALNVTCPTTPLPPGDTAHCTATYVTTQADVDAGSVTNAASASGTAPDASTVTSDPSTATVAISQTPSLLLTKSVTPSTADSAGDQVQYTFQVTNTGNVTVSDLAINDTLTAPAGPPLTISCPATTLAPTDQIACTAPYTLTQDDVDAGSVQNSATATGTATNGSTVTSNESTATVTVPAAATLTLTKSAAPTTVTTAGETVQYTFAVANSGNVTLHGLTIADTFAPPAGPPLGPITCAATMLAPAADTTCTAGYTVTQPDIDAGLITNTATAQALAPDNTPVNSDPSEAVVTAPADPALSLVKSASPATVSAVGDQVSYQFLVTNTGNVTIGDLTIDDALTAPAGPEPTITCPDTSLAPAAATTCTATYATTQADLDHGSITNSATAAGTDPTGDAVESNESAAAVAVEQSPALTVVKSASPSTVSSRGDTVDYSFDVTNTGNVTVTDLAIVDTLTAPAGPALDVTCPVTTLAPTAATTCTAAYAATQPDIDHGRIDNSAVAIGTGAGGQPVESDPSTAVVNVDQEPALTLVKTATPTTVDAAGAAVSYTFTVTNTGNVTMSGVSITDTFTAPAGPEPAIECPDTALAPRASLVCRSKYVVTQDDVDHGAIDNSAVADGVDPNGATITSPVDTAHVDITQTAALTLVKKPRTTIVSKVGETINYDFLVTNAGNVTITGISITDTLAPPAGPEVTASCPDTPVAPNLTVVCTADYLVTQADIDNGQIVNSATASGIDVNGDPVTSGPSIATVPVFVGPAAMTIVKHATAVDTDHNGARNAGDQLRWTFDVTNTGPVTLHNVAVRDAFAGKVSCAVTVLAPQASTACAADAPHVVTQAEMDAGSVSNTATATGVSAYGTDVVSLPSAVTVPLPAAPGLALVKAATVTDRNDNGSADVGDSVVWTFKVTNTGNVTVHGITVRDPLAGVVTCAASVLAPGQTVSCASKPHVFTDADADKGMVVNVATVSGTVASTDGTVTSPQARATVHVEQAPSPPHGPGSSTQHPYPPPAGTGVRDLPESIAFGVLAVLLGILLTVAGAIRRRRRDES